VDSFHRKAAKAVKSEGPGAASPADIQDNIFEYDVFGRKIAEREEGFLEAVRSAGLNPDEQRIVRLNDNLLFPELRPDSPYIEEIRKALGDVDGASGFVALNGRLLRGAALALCRMEFPLGRFTRPDLHGQFAVPLDGVGDTLVSVQPAYQLGYEAARLLLHSIETPGSATMQIRLDADVRLFEE